MHPWLVDLWLAFPENGVFRLPVREIECLLYDSHQKGKMMIMIVKTPGSQVDSPVAKGNKKGRRRKKDERPTQRHILTGDISQERTWHRTLCDLTKVKKKRAERARTC